MIDLCSILPATILGAISAWLFGIVPLYLKIGKIYDRLIRLEVTLEHMNEEE